MKKGGVFIIVPKKLFPRAVDRNRVKRRVRAALAGAPFPPGLRIRPGREALTMPFPELKQSLRSRIG